MLILSPIRLGSFFLFLFYYGWFVFLIPRASRIWCCLILVFLFLVTNQFVVERWRWAETSNHTFDERVRTMRYVPRIPFWLLISEKPNAQENETGKHRTHKNFTHSLKRTDVSDKIWYSSLALSKMLNYGGCLQVTTLIRTNIYAYFIRTNGTQARQMFGIAEITPQSVRFKLNELEKWLSFGYLIEKPNANRGKPMKMLHNPDFDLIVFFSSVLRYSSNSESCLIVSGSENFTYYQPNCDIFGFIVAEIRIDWRTLNFLLPKTEIK